MFTDSLSLNRRSTWSQVVKRVEASVGNAAMPREHVTLFPVYKFHRMFPWQLWVPLFWLENRGQRTYFLFLFLFGTSCLKGAKKKVRRASTVSLGKLPTLALCGCGDRICSSFPPMTDQTLFYASFVRLVNILLLSDV